MLSGGLFLSKMGSIYTSRKNRQKGAATVDTAPTASKTDRHPMTRLLMRWAGHARHVLNKIMAQQSLVGNPPVFDRGTFDWASLLEQNTAAIQQELGRIMQHRDAVPPLLSISPDHQGLKGAGQWQTFFLWGYGVRSDENAARCPRTAALVEQIPGLRSAFFSILSPGTEIPPHTGVTKALITAHLGLDIPKDRQNCQIRIDDDWHSWEEGKTLIFDDVYEHEVRNHTNQERIILLMHIERPMRPAGRYLARLFLNLVRHSPFVQDVTARLGDWEAKFRALEEAQDKDNTHLRAA